MCGRALAVRPLGRARLKSSNIGVASAVTSTLEGLMS